MASRVEEGSAADVSSAAVVVGEGPAVVAPDSTRIGVVQCRCSDAGTRRRACTHGMSRNRQSGWRATRRSCSVTHAARVRHRFKGCAVLRNRACAVPEMFGPRQCSDSCRTPFLHGRSRGGNTMRACMQSRACKCAPREKQLVSRAFSNTRKNMRVQCRAWRRRRADAFAADGACASVLGARKNFTKVLTAEKTVIRFRCNRRCRRRE